ncbi:MAG: cytochrome C [Caldimonas sp.]
MKVVGSRFGALTAVLVALACAQAAHAQASPGASVERGRYLARIAGCNDCHTAGYPESGGKVPEAQWLLGDKIGFSGPWGTTYPPNLRMSLTRMTEAEWLAFARTSQLRPPMPWFALRDMTDDDLRSIYRLVRQLGPVGEAAPAYLPPGTKAAGPVIQFP